MNQKEKVIEAIRKYELMQVELGKARQELNIAEQNVNTSQDDLVRVLCSVYGDRSWNGVVFAGRKYSARISGEVKNKELAVEEAEFDVLG